MPPWGLKPGFEMVKSSSATGVVTTSSTRLKLLRKLRDESMLARIASLGFSPWYLPFLDTEIRMLSMMTGARSLADEMRLGRSSSTSSSPLSGWRLERPDLGSQQLAHLTEVVVESGFHLPVVLALPGSDLYALYSLYAPLACSECRGCRGRPWKLYTAL